MRKALTKKIDKKFVFPVIFSKTYKDAMKFDGGDAQRLPRIIAFRVQAANTQEWSGCFSKFAGDVFWITKA